VKSGRASALARRDVVALILAAASWGVGTVVSKRALDDLPALTLLPIQLIASLAVLTTLMHRRGMSLRGSPALLGRLGILNPGLAYVLSLIGLASITASLSVLLWAIEPLMILVLAARLLQERITPLLVVLSLVAVVGMAVIVYDPASSGQWIGIVLTLAGVACCATYTVVTRRWLPTADSTAQVVFAQQAWALAFATVALFAAALLGGAVHPETVTAVGLLSAVASGVLYYASAYWFYITALRRVPASVAASSFYLIPVFGVAAGYLLLGERLAPQQWLGVVVVMAAVAAITRQHGPAERPAAVAIGPVAN
jgi:probable blue pigment (indigoidine) exporter